MVDKLVNIFDNSNISFLENDKSLLFLNVSERSWYSRFSIYLDKQIKKENIEGYYVDTEYNRNGNNLKTIFDNDSLEVINVTCDIILHSRGENIKNDNLLCIEMKKNSASRLDKDNDKKRLKLLTSKSFDNIWSADGKSLPEHVCGYKLGVYYEVNVKDGLIYIEYYANGAIFNNRYVKLYR